jgi:dTDP-4-amino-4,6-dideoxygalactose transaminase
MLAQLRRLGGFLEARRRHVELYARLLQGTEVTVPDFDWDRLSRPGDAVGYHIMPVLLPLSVTRLRVMAALREHGIQSSIHYPPVHRFSSFQNAPGSARLPRTEALASRELTLPLYPSLSERQIRDVCRALAGAVTLARGA